MADIARTNVSMEGQPARARKASRTVTPPVMRHNREESAIHEDPNPVSPAHCNAPQVSIHLVPRSLHNVLGVQWRHESEHLKGYEVQYGFDGSLDRQKSYMLEGRKSTDTWIAFLHDVYDTLHHGQAGCLNARVRVQFYDGSFSNWSDLASWSERSMVDVLKEGVDWVSDLMGLSKQQPTSSETQSKSTEEGSDDAVSTVDSDSVDNGTNTAAVRPRVELKRSDVIVRRKVGACHTQSTNAAPATAASECSNTARNPEKRITLKAFSPTSRRHSCPDLDAATPCVQQLADCKLKKSNTIQ